MMSTSAAKIKPNVPIANLEDGVLSWLVVSVLSVRSCRTKQGKPYLDCIAQNATGRITLRIWHDTIEHYGEIRPGLWGIVGHRSVFKDDIQFEVNRFKPITLEDYRAKQSADPPFPRAFTLDIETLALPEYRQRVPHLLKKDLRLGKMRLEQQQRYEADPAAEEHRCFTLGALSATSGRVLSIAVQVGALPDFGCANIPLTEHVFGIEEDGSEQTEAQTLAEFISFVKDYDCEADELVGHNIIDFDLPFILQRCLVHNITVPPLVNLGEYKIRGVYDTMRRWWGGNRRTVSLDDIAWAIGVASSKTDEVEGSLVYDLYQAGRLAEIRAYNLNDVRLTRKIYERMVAVYGR